MYILTIRYKDTNDTLNLTFDNEKEARKAFHNSVSTYGHDSVSITKEVA